MNSPRSARFRGQNRGTALIITLFFITLITVIAVAFLDSARVERAASSSHLERARAATLARTGLENLIGTLARETSNPDRNWITQPGALIVPNPLPADQKQLRKEIALSSGQPSAKFLTGTGIAPELLPPNLNIQTLVDQNPATYLINDRRDTNGNAARMPVRWIYLRDDGTTPLDKDSLAAEEPPFDKAHPIVGRYAYWADDESSKINYNLAWKRNPQGLTTASANQTRLSHPSQISLRALTLADKIPLTEALVDTLHNWTAKSPGRYFNSFADGRLVSPEIAKVLDYNKFELTHFNHDPDTTFFGEDRIILTTNRDLVPKNPDGTYARQFLDIMRDDRPAASLDPGNLDHIAGGQPDWTTDPSGNTLLPNKLDAAVRKLLKYVSSPAWPLSPGATFKDKYYPNTADTDARLAQLVINIIDYVRAKESPTPVIAPLRFGINPGDGKFSLHPTYAYGAANSYQGVCRAPYISEIGMWMEPTPVAPPSPVPTGWPNDTSGRPAQLYRCYFKGEVFLPLNYNLPDGIDLVPDTSIKPATNSTGWFFTWTETRDQTVAKYYHVSPNGQAVLMQTHGTNAMRILRGDLDFGAGPNNSLLMPGKYVVVTKMLYRDKPFAGRPVLSVRGALYKGTSGSDGLLANPLNRWPRVNIAPQAVGVNYAIGDPASTTMADMPSVETDEPRANVSPLDWFANKNKKNTFGLKNSASTLGLAPTRSPAGKPQQDTDENGKVSDASLYMPPPKGTGANDKDHDNGRVISIAELGYVNTGNDAASGSIPWRTIRLQPNNYPDAKVLPDWAFMDLFTVPAGNAGGPQAIYTPHGTSIGGRININAHVSPFETFTRNRGLVALLTGTASVATPADAEKIATNIYNQTLSTSLNKGKVYGYPWLPNPGPADPNAFDTPGEICEINGVADGGEKSEDLVREIASLITARGGVFSVYTVGQSIKQTPTGKLIVTAEQRQHAIVERYLDNRGTPADPADDAVRFRTIYARTLTP